ncbi:Protein OSB2, chloroplastic [Glycine max]|nr:Protein OSB2, chloroplastic [Glycine max]
MDVASLSFVVAIVHRLHLEEQELQNFPSQVIVMVQTLNFVQGYPQPNNSISINLKPEPEPEPKHSIPSAKRNRDSSSSSPWRDLVDNPMHWRDFRESKRNGLVKPRHPDFKRKDGHSLWLSKDNERVLPKLKGLQFDVPDSISKKGGGESWNDLVQNPDNWWDNRLNKVIPFSVLSLCS